jgi:hypothetical protein
VIGRLDLDTFIATFTDNKPDTMPEPHGVVYRGSSVALGMSYWRWLPEGFHERLDWRDGHFREVYVNDQLRSIITYCEGDISVSRHSTDQSYWDETIRSAEFYRTH